MHIRIKDHFSFIRLAKTQIKLTVDKGEGKHGVCIGKPFWRAVWRL